MPPFNALQTRAQLSLATLTLTITGFSDPRIAAAGTFRLYALIAGLILMLVSDLLIPWRGLRVRWLTQFRGQTEEDLLVTLIDYRDTKTRSFCWQIGLLGGGLEAYVAGVVSYFLLGAA